jgi:hypothetical protein
MRSGQLAAWMYSHPRVRRVWVMFQIIWGSALIAVVTAPRAAADSIAGSLSFTGLHDSYLVPIGSLFVSVLPMSEVIGAQGAHFGADPSTWAPAVSSALSTALTYTQLAGWLGLECAFFLCMLAIGIWLIKFALGAIWLGWLAAVARPIVANIQAISDRMELIPGGVLICVGVGGILCYTAGYGTGLGVIVGGLLISVLVWALLRDPVSELVGDNGVLGIGRSIGFTLSQGVMHNGPIAAGGTSGQLDTLTSWFCDVLARDVIELVSFGQVIDDIPGCANLFNQAILSGVTAAPAQAMKSCAPAAYAHSQQLSAITVGFFAMVIVLTLVVLLAVDYISCEAFRIGFKAFWNVLIIVPAGAAAVFPGPTRRFAKKAIARMLVHGAEMIAATAGLGILVLLMAQTTRGTLPGAIGMTNPLAKIMVMLLISVFGAWAFRHMMRSFGDTGIPGPLRLGRSAFGRAMQTSQAVDGIQHTGRKINDLRSRMGGRAGKPSGQGQTEGGGAGQRAPGRKAHPPTSANRPPSRPSGSAPIRPGPTGPGRAPTGASSTANPSTPAAAGASRSAGPASGAMRGATTAAGRTATSAATRSAARGAASAAAPEVALPVLAASAAAKAGKAVARHGHPATRSSATPPTDRHADRDDGGGPRSSPDRPPVGPPPGRTPPRPAGQ